MIKCPICKDEIGSMGGLFNHIKGKHHKVYKEYGWENLKEKARRGEKIETKEKVEEKQKGIVTRYIKNLVKGEIEKTKNTVKENKRIITKIKNRQKKQKTWLEQIEDSQRKLDEAVTKLVRDKDWFICDCGRVFKTREKLRRHKQRKDGINQEERNLLLVLRKYGRIRASEFEEKTGMSTSKFYDTLKKLRKLEKIKKEKEGMKVYYSLKENQPRKSPKPEKTKIKELKEKLEDGIHTRLGDFSIIIRLKGNIYDPLTERIEVLRSTGHSKTSLPLKMEKEGMEKFDIKRIKEFGKVWVNLANALKKWNKRKVKNLLTIEAEKNSEISKRKRIKRIIRKLEEKGEKDTASKDNVINKATKYMDMESAKKTLRKLKNEGFCYEPRADEIRTVK